MEHALPCAEQFRLTPDWQAETVIASMYWHYGTEVA